MEDIQAELTNAPSGRAVITVLGSDRAGIVAAVAGALATHEANILDISQTILKGNEPDNVAGGTGIFTMTMLVDLSPMDVDFQELDAELAGLADGLGVRITLVREDVFRFMYRL
ncbi:ACT domain-containing protein [Olsenella sp. YH-ols2217]|uniref:ACT domain-containing protein n=1 Tax=Kribbibacterium absianum TaxID=3044210 RepID=A0ABT6ZNA7_9ACTN|nr:MULTISPECIES: ACT domain-containing protein [unclassified Olsenella]MDJ1122143.1 ACT domain-containing protein [Olsenella sp. YH-ols2216]MDJ1130151.1 ACT domain-containing protein [Olsenella sp. YH-ols2217]